MPAPAPKASNLTFERANVFALPFADASFDLVWSKYLLQWLRERKAALSEFKRVAKSGGHVVFCDYVGCAVEHFPIDPELEKKVRDIMAKLVDVNIGRKVPAYMMGLGFRNVAVEIEIDTLFTVIGRIDKDRRQNLEIQFQAMRPHLIKILGSEANVTALVDRFLAHYDDPSTCSFTSLHFTRGQASRRGGRRHPRPGGKPPIQSHCAWERAMM